ncbi:MAG: hypothetical protein JWN71_3095 [Xanthobacteraceae bacterium]|nr:hypothetical protein [Xanthobacteraceae bacterium]
MKTNDLIRSLTQDLATPPPRLGARLALGLGIGFALAAALFFVVLGPRPDIAQAILWPRFDFKFVVTLSLAAASLFLVLRLARPAAELRPAAIALRIVLLILATGVGVELMTLPSVWWQTVATGKNAMVCLQAIPALAIPLLIGILLALRSGAPTRPALAGAAAGLLAGGLAATLYATHCTDDSPLFVAIWYSLAVGIVTAAGAIAGRLMLKW